MANFDPVKAIFSQADVNKDGKIDPNEFRKWLANANANNGYTSSSLESTIQASSGQLGGSSNLAFGSNVGLSGIEGAGRYQSLYSTQGGFDSSSGLATGGLANSYESSSSSTGLFQTAGSTLESSSVQQITQSNSGEIYKDPNPQVIRRAALGGAVTYEQKILVRFLQPPPVPPPGPLIIKEVRPPQPPPPPPLVIRQKAPPLPQPPPLVLRERPPVPPAAVASQTVIRRLAAIPVPPRSVIVERLPALPPKPRDIIIERWIPYGAQAKRRTIVQRAAAAQQYPPPRNVIIQYEPVQVRIVRQFQRLGVTRADPTTYLQQYGTQLLDAAALVQQARAAGVVEDISPPAVAASSTQFITSTGNVDTSYGYSGATISGDGGGIYDSSSSSIAEAAAFGGLRIIDYGAGDNYSSESYSSSSFDGVEGSSSISTGFDLAAATFASADANKDGSLDQTEFQRFIQGGLPKNL